MNGKRQAVLLAAGATAALGFCARTSGRLDVLTALAGALAIAFLASAAVASRQPGVGRAPAVALAFGVALVAVPRARDGIVPTPAPVIALLLLTCFHLLYPRDTASAPRVGKGPDRFTRQLARAAPVTLLAGLAVSFPLLAGLLPDRLAAARDLQGPAGPVAAAILVLAALACIALVGSLIAARRTPGEEAPSDQAGGRDRPAAAQTLPEADL